MFTSSFLRCTGDHLNLWVSSRPSKLETTCLILMSTTLYGRAAWLALDGEILNPAINLIAMPIAVLMVLWIRQEQNTYFDSKRGDRLLESTQSDSTQSDSTQSDSTQSAIKPKSFATLKSVVMYWSMLGGTLYLYGLFMLESINTKMIVSHNNELLLWRNISVICEGVGLFCLWSMWFFRTHLLSAYNPLNETNVLRDSIDKNDQLSLDHDLAYQLHYPLSLAMFTLPWEALLRHFDESLQVISTDIAVYLLDLFDWLKSSEAMQVAYWDNITIYSDRFYLIINETCAGVNLLLSMSLYTLGYAWVMKCTVKRCWLLVAYMMPLCLVFNGLRISMIFCLGHFGSQALATGPWHEGSAYMSQALLFLVLGLINYGLDAEPRSAKHGPSELIK